MFSLVRSALLAVPAALLAGCGVIGIATKGDLERQQAALELRDQEIAAEARTLRSELDAIGRGLSSLEKELAPRLESVEAELAALEGMRTRLEGLARRIEDAKQQLTVVEGKTKQEIARLGAEISAASAGAAEARQLAQVAEARGRHVSGAYLEGLRAERRRLQRELEEIGERLDAFGAPLETGAALERAEGAPR